MIIITSYFHDLGNGEGMFSTLRRLSTVSRRPRSKKKILDNYDKTDIETFSEQDSGDAATSGYVRLCPKIFDVIRRKLFVIQ